MHEVVQFLNANPIQYLATTDQNGNPQVRPFQLMLEKNGKLYFCTSNQKDVYQQIQHNPNVEICVSSPDGTWIRLSGKVVFSGDMNIKSEIIEKNPLVKSIYKTPYNPEFEIFYLEDAKATIADLSGQPPREYIL